MGNTQLKETHCGHISVFVRMCQLFRDKENMLQESLKALGDSEPVTPCSFWASSGQYWPDLRSALRKECWEKLFSVGRVAKKLNSFKGNHSWGKRLGQV